MPDTLAYCIAHCGSVGGPDNGIAHGIANQRADPSSNGCAFSQSHCRAQRCAHCSTNERR